MEKNRGEKKQNALTRFLNRFSYRTGIIVFLCCIPFYISSFAIPLYFKELSSVQKGTWWFVLFGLAKTFHYAGLTIIGSKGLINFLKKRKMKKIIFVCHGNICRSPMAEYIFKHYLKEAGLEDKYLVSSAAVSREEEGNGIHHGTKAILDKYGIEYGPHKAHQISLKEIEKAHLVLLMDSSNQRLIERLIPNSAKVDKTKIRQIMSYTDENRDVADPWYTGDFEQTYRDLSLSCRKLLTAIREQRP